MDAAKTKQLEGYATILEKQAQSAESQGNFNEAAKLYVKLIDIFLLLAREAPDHPSWSRYATRAEALQKKTKELIAAGESSQAGKGTSIKKIFGLKANDEKSLPHEAKIEKIPEQAKVPSMVASPIQAPEQMVPKRLYDQLLEKVKLLESRSASSVERPDYESLQNECRDLEAKIASMHSKSDYEELRLRLSNSVPRLQYEELQKAFVNLVPKDTYNAAQARISELESQLENSIPKSVLDNLANEISFLTVAASIPMTSSSGQEIQVVSPNHLNESPVSKHEMIQDELAMMKQRMDVLEMKIRSAHEESLKAEA